jgi:hemerythrin-like domain-containing protein
VAIGLQSTRAGPDEGQNQIEKERVMTATGLLKRDHAAVKRLLGQLARTTARAKKTRQILIEKLAEELEIHSRLEEEIFYPLLRERPESAGRLEEAKREHDTVRQRLAALRGTASTSSDVTSQVRALRADVLHHVREEEGELFPIAEALGQERLERVGEQLTLRKQELASGTPERASRKQEFQAPSVEPEARPRPHYAGAERPLRADDGLLDHPRHGDPGWLHRMKQGIRRLRGAA